MAPAIVAALCLAILLAWPRLVLGYLGISDLGFNEEPIGYRYFHSLRIAYGDADYPWLPQGQAMGLLQVGLQRILTIFGYDIADTIARISPFRDATIGFNIALIAVTFAWAFAKRSWSETLAAAGFIGLAAFVRTSFNWGSYILFPDYPALVIPLALITAGWVLRLSTQFAPTSAAAYAALGAFAAIALTLKVTYVVFPATIGLIFLVRSRSILHTLRGVIMSGTVCAAVGSLILLAYYDGHWDEFLAHFRKLAVFLRMGATVQMFNDIRTKWLTEDIFKLNPEFITFSMFSPLLFMAFAALVPNRKIVLLALAGGALLSSYVSFARFYGGTNLETNTTFACFFTVACLMAKDRAIWASRSFRWLIPAAAVGLPILAISAMLVLIEMTFEPMALTDRSDRAMAEFLAKTPGKTLFLIPDNAHRPLSIDSAIFKGGTDLVTTVWGGSALMRRLFPNRWYLYGGQRFVDHAPMQISEFGSVVISYFAADKPEFAETLSGGARYDPGPSYCSFETQQAFKMNLKRDFGVDIGSLTCPLQRRTGNCAMLTVCVGTPRLAE